MTDQGANLPRLDLLRQMSDRVVFEAIVRGPATRAELSIAAGLSKPTVSQAVRRLENAGLAEAAGFRTGRRGGVGTIYRVSRAAGAVLAVRLDQSGIIVRAVDLAGEIVVEHAAGATRDLDEAALGAGLRRCVLKVKAAALAGAPVRAAVISVASPVDPRTNHVVGLPDSPFPQAIARPAELLTDLVDGPIRVDNDVNLAALAERHEGSAGHCDSFAYLYLGAGLGAAVFLANDLVRGEHGLAGEIGWLPTSTAGGPVTLARQFAGARSRGVTPAVDVQAALATLTGPETADRTALLAQLSRTAAQGAAALCAAVDPELLVIGGPLGSIPTVAAALSAELRDRWPHEIAVRTGTLGEQGPRLGATRIGLQLARDAALAALSA